jgi:hypothetical protein
MFLRKSLIKTRKIKYVESYQARIEYNYNYLIEYIMETLVIN